MPDYQKAKIYKLWSPSKNLVYYGSTIETLASRLSKHNYNYKTYNKDNNKLYLSSYLVLDCEDYKMELVEEFPCNNRQQLLKKEGEYIKNNKCVNMCVAGRTSKEWNVDNKENQKEYKKNYREEHKEELKQKDKIYIKTKGKEKKIISQKTYREKNKEKNKENTKYYNEIRKQNRAIYKWLLWTGLIQ